MEEDQEWISRVLKGDTQAYTNIINKYKNKVYALLLRMVNRPEDAKDLTQECFIKAYNYLHSYSPAHAFSTWLCRIAINLCIDAQRKQKRMTENLKDSMDEGVRFEERSPETIYLRRESERELHHLIDELPDPYRMVLLLRYVHDLTCQEIGDMLNLPANTVQVRLYRARVKLRECYQATMERGAVR